MTTHTYGHRADLRPAARRGHRAPIARRRSGVSLVEVLVAVSLLSLSLLAFARISPLLNQYGRKNDVQLNRAYVLQQQGDRIMAMPYTNFTNGSLITGTKTLTIQGYQWQRTVTVSDSVGMKKVMLIMKPLSTSSALRKPDTLVLWRGPGASCPLNTISC